MASTHLFTFALSCAMAIAVPAAPCWAQNVLMREGEVSVQSLVEALGAGSAPQAAAPVTEPSPSAAMSTSTAATAATAASAVAGETDQAPDPNMHTRSIRLSIKPARRPAAAVEATRAGPAKASILVTFVTGSAELTASAKGALDVLAKAMADTRLANLRFTIEGHADPRGSTEYNQDLSRSRAQSVRTYLMSQHGMPAERVDAVGKGSQELLNTTDTAAPENRRVTIVAQPKL